MPFTVTHQPGVDDELMLIWLTAPDSNAVADAANRINQLLRFMPGSAGIDCGDHRELTIAPLRTHYTFSPDDCMVTVTRFEFVD